MFAKIRDSEEPALEVFKDYVNNLLKMVSKGCYTLFVPADGELIIAPELQRAAVILEWALRLRQHFRLNCCGP